ncbi:MAG: DUF6602 domain-containing protein [Nanoarchaeota archaeon]
MIERDLIEFHKSINSELLGIKDRVRNIIGASNWGDDGRYKEAILKNVITRFLPKNYSISSGFVINPNLEITKQIDLIIYDDSSPLIFKEGDFAIVHAHSVRGIIEVKTQIGDKADLKKIINIANNNANLIKSITTENRPFFNGIFAYDCKIRIDKNLKEELKPLVMPETMNKRRFVNNISLGSNYFFHILQHPVTIDSGFNGYKIENLSFAFFIFNLLNTIDSNPIKDHENKGLYFPLDKNSFKID